METIKKLLVKRLQEALSAEEEKTLEDWMDRSPQNRAMAEEIGDPDRLYESFAKLDNLRPDLVWERVRAFSEAHRSSGKTPALGMRLLKGAWIRYAAAVIVLLGTAAYFWQRKETVADLQVASMEMPMDIPAPTTTRAAITLAGGRQILIDSVPPGLLAMQGNVQIRKRTDGCIEYIGAAKAGAPLYNTLSVPRGSRIAGVIFSDGSKVFLNAASCLTYPVAFSKKERRTQVTGEAYFEVSDDPSRKFIVTGGGMTTQVLGTHFNVNSYPDETVKNVTLLEGRVRVSEKKFSLIVQPGQQATYSRGVMQLNTEVNTNQVIAWKNGLFDFQDQHLSEVMRQLARWYDLQVVYAQSVPDIEFFGQMGRNLKLSNVLEVLKSAGVKFRLEEGRRLFIM